MALSEDQLRRLLEDPRETLDVELKGWIDPKTEDGIAKIAKGCLALRNANGGTLIIGFKDDGTPDDNIPPFDVATAFHIDNLQRIVGQFSSEPFGIEVQFGQRDAKIYPVISIPPGVRTPVAARKDHGPQGKPLIKDHAVYVRSLSSNSTVSSSEARRGDWDRLVQICLDNREADIGSFVRRHLSGLDLNRLSPVFSSLLASTDPPTGDSAKVVLETGYDRFKSALVDRVVESPEVGFREVAVVIDGEFPNFETTLSFLQRLFVAQPLHIGLPAWADTRHFASEFDRPKVFDGAWETLLYVLDGDVQHLEFWRINPAMGTFYLLTGLEDDLETPGRRPERLTQLDFVLQIARVAEIISVAMSFARAMECEPSKAGLNFLFRWRNLKGRRLTSWVQPRRYSHLQGSYTQDDDFETTIKVPLDAPRSAIVTHVESVVRKLFASFGGAEIPTQIIAEIVEESLRIRF